MKEKADKIILDVRTAGEYADGHIPGAVMIDYYKNDFRQQINKLDKSKPVFVYCASGVRSSSAAKSLSSRVLRKCITYRAVSMPGIDPASHLNAETQMN